MKDFRVACQKNLIKSFWQSTCYLTRLINVLYSFQIIRIYPLKPSDQTDSFFVDAVVDVDPYNCEDAYLYTSDFLGNGIVVYSWAKNDSWRIEHNYFHFDPLNGETFEQNIYIYSFFENRIKIISFCYYRT